MKGRTLKKCISLMVAVLMVVQGAIPALATEIGSSPVADAGVIAKFGDIPGGPARTVEKGRPLKELGLPPMLSVELEDGKSALVAVEQWQCDREYDGDVGQYTFTPKLAGDFEHKEPLPAVTVTVSGDGTEAAAKPAAEPAPQTENVMFRSVEAGATLGELNLPNSLNGENGQAVEVRAWQSTPEYTGEPGLYVFMAEGAGGQEASAAVIVVVREPEGKIAPFGRSIGGGNNPVNIYHAAQLWGLGQIVNKDRMAEVYGNVAQKFTLQADIDLSGYNGTGDGWTPIGTDAYPFKGDFDGNGHVVKNLTVNRPDGDYAGLFGRIEDGFVSNLGVINCNVTGQNYVGGLAGELYKGRIENSYAVGSVHGTVDNVGGLAGYVVESNMTNCCATASVTGDGACVGGLAGFVSTGNVTGCYAAGSVYGTYDYVGGLVGCVIEGHITDSYATASVTGDYVSVGGLVGAILYDGSITSSYATGSVTGTDVNSTGYQIGGLAGYVTESRIISCYATGSVSGSNMVGGLAGEVYDSSITGCAALNPSVEAADNIYRVIGCGDNNSLSAYAYEGMTVNGSLVSNADKSGVNGANVSADDISKADFWGSIDFTADNGWTIESNKLPILTGVGGNQTGKVPSYIISGKYFEGDGTVDAPYQISTAEELAKLADLVNNGTDADAEKYNTNNVCYRLEADIDLSNYSNGWTPIGTDNMNPFKAKFNGGGKVVDHLTIDRQEGDFTGLFGYIDGGSVNNLGVVNCSVTGRASVGGLAGFVSSGSGIENSYATGSVSGNAYVGGLAGGVDGSITNSYATGSVSGTGYYVGGLAGFVSGSITDSYATSSVSGTGYSVGGLAGYVSGGSIKNSYATGSVSGTDDNVGGLTGYVSSGSITNSYATGSVSGNAYVGGLAGYVHSDSGIENSYATGSVSGNGDNVGGLAGVVSSGSIKNSYATGSVSGNDSVGGLAGHVSSGSSITGCAALNPSVKGVSNTNRVVGYNDGATLTDNYAYEGMTVNGSTVTDGETGNVNGANVSADDISKADFWKSIGFKADNGWTIESKKLPILTGVGGNQTGKLPSYISGKYFEGDGTVDAPYRISTAEELAKLAEIVNTDTDATEYNHSGVYYLLVANIDLSGYSQDKGWKPIGIDVYKSFKANFDGGKKVVRNLTINRPGEDYIGLFGYIVGGFVSNLGVENCSVTGEEHVGGLAGLVSGGNSISRIENSYATGSVTGTGNYVGGLAGDVSGGSGKTRIENSYATGSVTGTGNWVGGLAGYVSGGSSILSSYATGSVTGGNGVGGLAGYVSGGSNSITNSYATGSVTGGNWVGGLAGYVSGSSIFSSYATGSVTGGDDVGGLAGYVSVGGSILSSYATGSVTGGNDVGGLAGYVNGSILSSYATGSVTGTGNWVGGLAGYAYGSILSSYATGPVTGGNDVGGLVGYVDGDYEQRSEVKGCAALNPYVDSDGENVNRVVGYVEGNNFTISGNYAFAGMEVNGTASSSENAESKAGADIGIPEVTSLSFWKNTMEYDETVWTLQEARMPVLQKAGGNQPYQPPFHLIGFATGELELTAPGETYSMEIPQKSVDLKFTVTGMEGWTDSEIEWKATEDKDLSFADKTTGTAILTIQAGRSSVVTVSAINTNSGKSAECSITFDVPKPVVTVKVSSPTGSIYTGDRVTLTADNQNMLGVDESAFKWYREGSTAELSTEAKYTFEAATAGTTEYYCVVTNMSNKASGIKSAISTSSAVTVNVLLTQPQAPVITMEPSGGEVTLGESATLSAETETGMPAGGKRTYTWYESVADSNTGGKLIEGKTDKTLTVTPATAGTTYYYCTVTDTANSQSATSDPSQTAKVTAEEGTTPPKPPAKPQAPVITMAPSDGKVTLGESVTLSAETETGMPAGGKRTYTWYESAADSNTGGKVIEGKTDKTLTVTPATEGTTYYYCTVTDTANGQSATSDPSQTASVTATKSGGSGGGGGGGSYRPTPEAGPGIVVITDGQGNELGSFDLDKLTVKDKAMELTVDKESDEHQISINIQKLIDLQKKYPGGTLIIRTPDTEYNLPFDVDNIDGLKEYMADNKLKAEGLYLRLTFRKLTGDELKKAIADYEARFPGGQPVTDFYDISIGLYTAEGKRENFGPISFAERIKFSLKASEEATGGFIYDDGNFAFVPMKWDDGVAMFETNHHSIYVGGRNKMTFADIDGHWGEETIETAANKALIAGMGDGRFAPDNSVTRAQIITMVANALNLADVEPQMQKYADVNESHWSYESVGKMQAAGLLDVYDGDKLEPERAATREELAAILAAAVRYAEGNLKEENIDLSSIYNDSGDISPEQMEDVGLMYQLSIMQGKGQGTFGPKDSTTRAQAATVLLNMLEALGLI